MDLDDLFVSDLLDTLVGRTLADDRSTTQSLGEEGDEAEPVSSTQALGEEGEQPEDTWDTEPEPVSTTQALGEEGEQPEDTWDTEPEPVSTTQALGEDGDQPEDTWDTEIEPPVTTDSVGEDGDEPEPDGSDAPTDQGIWAGEDGNGGGCVIEVDDTVEPEECEPADDEEPVELDDPLNCW